jgi:hypothetical protein
MQLCIYFLYSVQDEMSVEQQSTPSEEQKETGDRYRVHLSSIDSPINLFITVNIHWWYLCSVHV